MKTERCTKGAFAMTLKTIIRITAVIIFLYAAVVFVDYGRAVNGSYPIFCINNNGHYQGLGYSYDMYPHPITGEVEYSFYLFGCQVESNFTN
ncbi:MAG: hypothetical protein K2O14_11315 [Oscillospiraceae bacterium]|nr:hypothetical protein [Oscillospiraceae bacterium]